MTKKKKKGANACYLSTGSSTNQSRSSSHRNFFTTVPWGLGSTQYKVCKWTSISGILDLSMSIKYPSRIRSTTRCVTINRSDVILSSSIINGFSLWITSRYDSPPIPTMKKVKTENKTSVKGILRACYTNKCRCDHSKRRKAKVRSAPRRQWQKKRRRIPG